MQKELDGYLDCGLLCRGFARLRCDGCAETRLVAFACKGRGFCPSCLGRKMSATAANLLDYVMPKVPLRQVDHCSITRAGTRERQADGYASAKVEPDRYDITVYSHRRRDQTEAPSSPPVRSHSREGAAS